jgi:uncharacterized protein (DUF885 family)
MTLRPALAAALLALAAFACPATAAEPDPAATRALHALFDRHWQWQAERFPEWATYRGDLRFNDRLFDASPAAQAADDAQAREFLAAAQAVPAERLSATDRVSRDIFIQAREREVELQRHPGWRTMLIGALGGVHSQFADLMLPTPMNNAAQAEQLLARMAAYPRLMAQQLARMREGIRLGWVPARDVLERARGQLDAQLALPLDDSPYFGPFKRLGRDVPAEQRGALQARGRAAIERDVLPPLRQLRAFIVDEYLPKAPANGALAGYPQGPEVYAMLVRQQTTTSLAPREIHDIGQRELARLHGEIRAVMQQMKFDGDFAAFVKHLNSDPKYFVASPEALLAGYREIAKRIDAEMPRLFAELPRAPYGIRAMPSFRGPDAAEYYDRPAQDGSRPGWFNAAASGFAKKPTWSMATLTAHEAVPGHHLQIARAIELKGLPEFRRGGFGYTAFSEGWALYAETLGLEIGLYDDPAVRFGHLQAQALRAARLVVDTGIHALGWSRQQAIDFMVERTGLHRDFVTSEVDRYTSNPGQALAYMIGQLKIQELRQRAKTALGPKFDLRRFHNAVIDQGALPLDTLEREIDGWIAAQRG